MTASTPMLLTVSVADLRKEPSHPLPAYGKDMFQESQLLFGERLLKKEEKGEWIFVEAVNQPKFIDQWQGYPGWIKKSQAIEVKQYPTYNLVVSDLWANINQTSATVCLGTKLEGIELRDQWWQLCLPNGSKGYIHQASVCSLQCSDFTHFGKNVIALGEKLLNHPYHWGGCSIYNAQVKEVLTGVDCSSLVHLLYRVYGKEIPRDAHDQFLTSRPLEFQQLKIGDLIFIRYHDKPKRIGHVMLYAGEDGILDANITDKQVVKTQAALRYGCPLHTMKYGEDIGIGRVYFGSAL